MNRPNSNRPVDTPSGNSGESPQEMIERGMRQIVGLGHYEAAYLLTDDGLPLAEVAGNADVSSELLFESALQVQDVRRMVSQLGSIPSLREIIIEGENKRKVVFRFLEAFGQGATLAVVVPPRKTFKAFTNRLVSFIRKTTKE